MVKDCIICYASKIIQSEIPKATVNRGYQNKLTFKTASIVLPGRAGKRSRGESALLAHTVFTYMAVT